jgi:hypothetical protein
MDPVVQAQRSGCHGCRCATSAMKGQSTRVQRRRSRLSFTGVIRLQGVSSGTSPEGRLAYQYSCTVGFLLPYNCTVPYRYICLRCRDTHKKRTGAVAPRDGASLVSLAMTTSWAASRSGALEKFSHPPNSQFFCGSQRLVSDDEKWPISHSFGGRAAGFSLTPCMQI